MTANQAAQETIKEFERVTADLDNDEYSMVLYKVISKLTLKAKETELRRVWIEPQNVGNYSNIQAPCKPL